MEKHCRCCNTTKPITDFYKLSASKDGHNYWCKVCSHNNRLRYGRERSVVKNPHGVRATGERLQLAVEDAMTRFELRLNFTGIERLI